MMTSRIDLNTRWRRGISWRGLAAMPPLMRSSRTVCATTCCNVDTVYSLGFVKPFPKWVFGSSEKAFGTAGAGGSFGFADPDTGIGFAYAMNRMGFHLWSDPRELALRHTLFHNIIGARPQT
jgi:CubicO group peptidase (beta-lactamase class C family)